MFDNDATDQADLNGSDETVAEMGIEGDQATDSGASVTSAAGDGQGASEATAADAPEPYELPSIGFKTEFTPQQRKALSEAGLDGLLDRFRHVDERARRAQSYEDRYNALVDQRGSKGGNGAQQRQADPEPAAKSPAQLAREAISTVGKAFEDADREAVANGGLVKVGSQIQSVLEAMLGQNERLQSQVDALSGGVNEAYSTFEPTIIGREIAEINQQRGVELAEADVMPYYRDAVAYFQEQGYSADQIRKSRSSVLQLAWNDAMLDQFKKFRANPNPTPGAIQGQSGNPSPKRNGSPPLATGPTRGPRQAAPIAQQDRPASNSGDPWAPGGALRGAVYGRQR